MRNLEREFNFDVVKVLNKVFNGFFQNFKDNYKDFLQTPTEFDLQIQKLTHTSTLASIKKFSKNYAKHYDSIVVKPEVKNYKHLPMGIAQFVETFEYLMQNIIQNIAEQKIVKVVHTKTEMLNFFNTITGFLKEEMNHAVNSDLNRAFHKEHLCELVLFENIFKNLINTDNEAFYVWSPANYLRLAAVFFNKFSSLENYEEFSGDVNSKHFDSYLKVSWVYLRLAFMINILYPLFSLAASVGENNFDYEEFDFCLCANWFFNVPKRKVIFGLEVGRFFAEKTIITFLFQHYATKPLPKDDITSFMETIYCYYNKLIDSDNCEVKIFNTSKFIDGFIFHNYLELSYEAKDYIKGNEFLHPQIADQFTFSWDIKINVLKLVLNAELNEKVIDLFKGFICCYQAEAEVTNWVVAWTLITIGYGCVFTKTSSKNNLHVLSKGLEAFYQIAIEMALEIYDQLKDEQWQFKNFCDYLKELQGKNKVINHENIKKLKQYFNEWDFVTIIENFDYSVLEFKELPMRAINNFTNVKNTKNYPTLKKEKYSELVLSLINCLTQMQVFLGLKEIFVNDYSVNWTILDFNFWE